ncbi:unnamed protein product [Ixodes hexagonus]
MIHIDLEKKPEWLFGLNPAGKVPIFHQDDKILYESLLLCEYLDEAYGGGRLITSDPYLKAKDKLFIDEVTAAFMPSLKMLYRSENKKDIWLEQNGNFRACEAKLKERKTNFFAGDAPGFVDYMIWPFFCIAFCAPAIFQDLQAPSDQEFPLLVQWMGAIRKDRAAVALQLEKRIVQYWKGVSHETPSVNIR